MTDIVHSILPFVPLAEKFEEPIYNDFFLNYSLNED